MKAFAGAALALLTPVAVAAQGIDYTINLTEASPHWQRPVGLSGSLSGVGANVPYAVVPILVGGGASFAVTATGGTHPDAYMFVYTDFDPTTPLVGRVISDDDGGVDFLPGIGTALGDPALDPGTYDVVVTSFGSGGYGTLTFNITGVTLAFGPSSDEMAQDLSLHRMDVQKVAAPRRAMGLFQAVSDRPAGGLTPRVSSKSTGETAPQALRLWSSFGRERILSDVEAFSSAVQFGVDRQVAPELLLGVALSFETMATRTDDSSSDGTAVYLQPYAGFEFAGIETVVSAAFGAQSYTDYTSQGVSGAADARSVELSATFARDFALKDGMTMKPFLQVTAGRDVTDYNGDLNGVEDGESNYRATVLGAEMTRPLASGAQIYGRYELMHYVDDVDNASLSVASADPTDYRSRLTVGLAQQDDNGVAWRIEPSVMREGEDWIGAGIQGSFELRF